MAWRCGTAVAFLLSAAAERTSPRASCDSTPIRVAQDTYAASNATRVLVDGCGRVRNFRGLNSVNKGFPYYPDPATFAPNGNSLSPEMASIWRSLGLNLVRLGVMWSGAVPLQRGGVNATYLSVLANLSASLYTDYGILSMLDAHQVCSRLILRDKDCLIALQNAPSPPPFPCRTGFLLPSATTARLRGLRSSTPLVCLRFRSRSQRWVPF
jgi:hypothetical protein